MSPFIENNRNNKIVEGDATMTDKDLRTQFQSIQESDIRGYSGKCSYCNVEINSSDPEQIKIKVEYREGTQKFSIYHKGCYERYLRRTID